MTRLFAQLIARHLDDQRKLADSEEALSLSREAHELREQFVAVLGHDLKNPVAALRGGVRPAAQGTAKRSGRARCWPPWTRRAAGRCA